MTTALQSSFFELIRLGIGASKVATISEDIEWDKLKTLAEEHGLSAIVLDALNMDGSDLAESMPVQIKLEWIGEVLQGESVYAHQRTVAVDMANLFYNNDIRAYVLKGNVISECYPRPNHRVSADIDCYLQPVRDGLDAWSLGNDLIRAKGFQVNTDFYKNSSFDISGVIIENHQFFTPFRANKKLAEFERLLHALMKQIQEDVFEDTHIYRPPVQVTALFLIEHSYSHFLHEGLTWRHVLDWMMFRNKHQKEILWADFDVLVDEYGFKKFYESFLRLGRFLLGEIQESYLTKEDKKMLADVWAPLDLHDSVRGFKGKIALAGNTWRARWKYRYFTEMSWVTALWIQVKGFLFEKNPKLN